MNKDAKGKIVVVTRGVCHFNVKVANAEAAGAAGVIVINSDDKMFRMGGGNEEAPQEIPSYLITKTDGDLLRALFKDSAGLGAKFAENDVKERYLWKESHLYISDASGLHFSTSLQNIAYTAQSYDDQMMLQPEVSCTTAPQNHKITHTHAQIHKYTHKHTYAHTHKHAHARKHTHAHTRAHVARKFICAHKRTHKIPAHPCMFYITHAHAYWQYGRWHAYTHLCTRACLHVLAIDIC